MVLTISELSRGARTYDIMYIQEREREIKDNSLKKGNGNKNVTLLVNTFNMGCFLSSLKNSLKTFMNFFKIKTKKREESEKRNDSSLPMSSQTVERILNSSLQNFPDIINHSFNEKTLNLSFCFNLSPVISHFICLSVYL